MNKTQIDLSTFIKEILQYPTDKIDHETLKQLKRKFSQQHKLSTVISNVELLASYRKMIHEGSIQKNEKFEELCRKRSVRSLSGIVSVQVLTKPFWCPGKCIFCPNDATMPKSYINTEPGAMRALLNQFDPYKQVYNRLTSLTLTGHNTEKIEMIVLGGTRDVYPQEYKTQFVKGLYDACNSFETYFNKLGDVRSNPKAPLKSPDISDILYPETIEESIHINQTAKHKIIGLTVETRPEYVTDENCRYRRTLGVTRIEMGIQNLFDDVLDANKRGHNVAQAQQASHKLRMYGFKISLHMMPGLYMSTYQKDFESFEKLYNDIFFKPDEIKFYPTSVIPNTELYNLYRSGQYKPLETPEIKKLIREVFIKIIPSYTRIKRLIRDIPSTEIVAGSKITNLSQLIHEELAKNFSNDTELQKIYQRLFPNYHHIGSYGELAHSLQWGDEIKTFGLLETIDTKNQREFISLDTRSREIRHKKNKKNKDKIDIFIRTYHSSIGRECFISYEDSQGFLYGFLRLTLPDPQNTQNREGLGKGCSLVRELHIYGKVVGINTKYNKQDVQHTGLGTMLLTLAEEISTYHKYGKISVISGVGVRGFYEKRGYTLEGTYMVKYLS